MVDGVVGFMVCDDARYLPLTEVDLVLELK